MLGVCLALIDDEEDRKAFERLVEKYQSKMFLQAKKILYNPALAEEALWDAFSRIAKNFQKVNNLSVYKMEAYLVITIKRSCYNIYNNEKKHKNDEPVNEVDEIIDITEFDRYSIVELSNVLCDLDEKYKTVLSYMIFYGYSADETAKMMGVSRTCAYKYFNKAKQIIYKRLGDDKNV